MSATRRSRGRIVAVAAATALAVLLTAGVVAWSRIPRDDVDMLTPGSFTVAEHLPGETRIGDLTVVIAPGPEPRVEVREGARPVWSSVPGTSFLAAARTEIEAEESRGYFWLRTTHERRWTAQTLQSVEAAGEKVTLRGILDGDDDGDGGAGIPWSATFTGAEQGVVLHATIEADDATTLAFWSARTEGSPVHGFGEQFMDFNLDGRLLPIIAREQGVGRGEQPLTMLADVTNHGAGGTAEMTYAAWPSWVTGDLRGVRLDPENPGSHAIAVADLRRPDQVGLELHSTTMRAVLTAADSPLELVARQQAGAERPELAEWTSTGAIIGIQGGTDAVRAAVASLQEAGTEIAGVWLQDWTGQRSTSFGERLWWTWQLDHQRYPGWSELVSDLEGEGIAVTTYVNPFLVDPADKENAPERDLFAEAERAGYLVQDAQGNPYPLNQGGFDAYLVDLTHGDARAWFAEVIATEVLAQGVRGFMADFAEGLPLDAVLADGDPLLLHNRWPAMWAETVTDACELAGQPDCVRWFRTGSLGMDADSPLFWNGDQLVTFGSEDGLASVLGATFSAGVSGWPLVHSDVGGYTSINAVVKDYVRTPELLARWAEFAAFGVVMRTHEGNRPAHNPQVYTDDHTRRDFARASRIFAALADYRAEVVAQARATGVPALRHGWLNAPGTAAAWVDTQFFFGDSVLVAPVLHEGAVDVEVSFPPGRWRHLLTGEEFDGDRVVEVPAPIGTPAAFVEVTDPWAPALTEALAGLD